MVKRRDIPELAGMTTGVAEALLRQPQLPVGVLTSLRSLFSYHYGPEQRTALQVAVGEQLATANEFAAIDEVLGLAGRYPHEQAGVILSRFAENPNAAALDQSAHTIYALDRSMHRMADPIIGSGGTPELTDEQRTAVSGFFSAFTERVLPRLDETQRRNVVAAIEDMVKRKEIPELAGMTTGVAEALLRQPQLPVGVLTALRPLVSYHYGPEQRTALQAAVGEQLATANEFAIDEVLGLAGRYPPEQAGVILSRFAENPNAAALDQSAHTIYALDRSMHRMADPIRRSGGTPELTDEQRTAVSGFFSAFTERVLPRLDETQRRNVVAAIEDMVKRKEIGRAH